MTRDGQFMRRGRGDVIADRSVLRLRVTVLALMAFAVGATQAIKVNVIGEAALAELLLPVAAVVASISSEGRRLLRTGVFWLLLVAMAVTLTGYVISDLVHESAEAQYLRGWGRIALVMADFVGLCLLVSAQRQTLWWFVAGMGIGRLVYLRLALAAPISMWKFSYDGYGYGEPLTLAVASLGFFLPPRIAPLLLAGVGLISIYYDFRVQSAVCLLVAGLLWARSRWPSQSVKGGGVRLKIVLLSLAAVGVIYAGLELTHDDYAAQRRGVSDIGRAFGKAFAIKAISNSPWIGYGSWSRSAEFERLQRDALKEVAGSDAGKFEVGDSSSATHSMLLQAWVEGGILGTALFFALAFLLIRNFGALVLTRPLDALFPLLVYFALYGLWHIVMSAFAAPLRLHLALAAAVVVCLALERGLARRQRTARVGTATVPSLQ
jgi:hypothetical protein